MPHVLKVSHILPAHPAVSGVHVWIRMQDYKSLHVAFMICTTTHGQTAFDQLYSISWKTKPLWVFFCHILYKTRPILIEFGTLCAELIAAVMQTLSTSPEWSLHYLVKSKSYVILAYFLFGQNGAIPINIYTVVGSPADDVSPSNVFHLCTQHRCKRIILQAV